MDDGGRADRACGAERVAERDRAAHRIHLRRVEADAVDHRQRLRGEGFVQLDPADVGEVQAGIAERRGNRLDRPDAHDLGRHAARREADEARQRLEVVLLDRLLAREDQRAGAVAGLRAVARGDAALGGEHGLEPGQAFERRVGARALVELDGAGLRALLAGRQVGKAVDDLDRRDLVGELARLLGLQCTQVRLERERVLRFAADLPLRRDLLGRQAHAVGDADVLVPGQDLGVERRLVAAHRHEAHRLGAAGDEHVGLADADAIGGHLDGGDPRGAEAVHRHAGHRVRQRELSRDACHVHALLGLGERAADDRVLDRLRIQRRHLRQRAADRRDQQVVGPCVPEVAPARPADRCARGGDDVGVLNLLGHVGQLRLCVSSGRRGTGLAGPLAAPP